MSQKTKKRLRKAKAEKQDSKVAKVATEKGKAKARITKAQLDTLKKGTKKAKAAPKAAKVAKPASTKRMARVAFNDLFSLSGNLVSFAKGIQTAILKTKGILEQPPHKDYVAWAVPGSTGTLKRVGGLWEHGRLLCLQIRWMSPDVLKRAKSMGFTIYGTPTADLKCNRVHIATEADVKNAVELLKMQARDIVDGKVSSSNLNA